MISATMTHGDVPPSLNAIGSRGSHWAYTKAKREWQDIIFTLLLLAEVPRRLAFVRVDAVLRFPLVRRRDAGNFAWLLEKAAGDALVAGRFLVDDTPQHYVFESLTFDPELGPRRTTLQIAYRP